MMEDFPTILESFEVFPGARQFDFRSTPSTIDGRDVHVTYSYYATTAPTTEVIAFYQSRYDKYLDEASTQSGFVLRAPGDVELQVFPSLPADPSKFDAARLQPKERTVIVLVRAMG
ncbi:MAG: hypothetical protein U0271_22730 [Polyangiaceae bacterium]